MPLNPAPKLPKAPKPGAPSAAVAKPPRLKPASTREYGKGGTPLSQNLSQPMNYGANVGFGGSKGWS